MSVSHLLVDFVYIDKALPGSFQVPSDSNPRDLVSIGPIKRGLTTFVSQLSPQLDVRIRGRAVFIDVLGWKGYWVTVPRPQGINRQ